MVRCRVDASVFCPFYECISDSIEGCNFCSGRFSNKLAGYGTVNFSVLRGSKFVELRRSSSF